MLALVLVLAFAPTLPGVDGHDRGGLAVPAAEAATTTPPGPTSTDASTTTSTTVQAAVLSVPILTYHYVDSKPAFGVWGKLLTVSPAEFEKQMDYLQAAGYHTVTMEQLYGAAEGEFELPSNPVAITFDDGGRDGYSIAYPILKSHGFVATFFIVGDFVGKPGFLSWTSLAKMVKGHMCVESHTLHHHDLTKCSDAKLTKELAGSRATLEDQLGVDAQILAYPGGKYDARVEAAAQAAGFVAAVTVRPGTTISTSDTYTWPRIAVGPLTTLTAFEAALKD